MINYKLQLTKAAINLRRRTQNEEKFENIIIYLKSKGNEIFQIYEYIFRPEVYKYQNTSIYDIMYDNYQTITNCQCPHASFNWSSC